MAFYDEMTKMLRFWQSLLCLYFSNDDVKPMKHKNVDLNPKTYNFTGF